MLRLYEELALLALDETRGVYTADYAEFGMAGALFAELLLEKRIAIEPDKSKLVNVVDPAPVGEPLLDECLQKMVVAKRRMNAQAWIAAFTRISKLRHRIAEGLCSRGTLRPDRARFALFFSQKVYPEVDPRPEQDLRARLEEAIFTDIVDLDPRTVVLVALADNAGFLRHVFGRKRLKQRKDRLAQIKNGDVSAKATADAIAAMNAVIMMTAIMPAIIASSASN
jgi:hypothetical protein